MANLSAGLRTWLEGSAETDLLRWLFATVLTATLAVAAFDYVGLTQSSQGGGDLNAPGNSLLPDANPAGVLPRDRMTFDLQPQGRLLAKGEIAPGTARELAAAIDKHGEYIKTVVLQSPGGSLQDALAMGRLIRQRRFATEVPAAAQCVSACPLMFAGGVERSAGAKAVIGVHRAIAVASEPLRGRAALDEGQRISAQSQRYLADMGVDTAVWLFAMETPNERLYTFSPQQLRDLKLVTR